MTSDDFAPRAIDYGPLAVAVATRQFERAPIAFACTEGSQHTLRSTNALFQQLLSSRSISIGVPVGNESVDLTPLLERAFRDAESIRDELLVSLSGAAHWSCTVWPIPSDDVTPVGLMLEVREANHREVAILRQRAITERLLLGVLREQDVSLQATQASRRATFLAAAGHDLARSLDRTATLDLIRRSALPREGAWCIVDIIESADAIHRLAVVHPDQQKQALAQSLADEWYPTPEDPNDILSLTYRTHGEPVVITKDSEEALLAAVHGPGNLAVLRRLGFGALLVVPLVVHDTVLGRMMFVSPTGDESFSAEETALAIDLADRCAMALDNARLYCEADALRSAADEANRAKSQFLGNVSHELRTPLHAIGNYVDLLELTGDNLTQEQRSDLGRIKHNQQHLATLISQLLNFVRDENGRVEYRFTTVPAAVALQEVTDLLRAPIRDGRIALELQPGDPGVAAWADQDRVRQILVNLVTNAVKYGPAEGSRITLSSSATSETVSMHVADTGQGIPSDKLEAIFEPFVQLTGGRRRRQGGVGLGLAISRDLARAMNGDLTAESTVGAGSRFTLTLPRATRFTL